MLALLYCELLLLQLLTYVYNPLKTRDCIMASELSRNIFYRDSIVYILLPFYIVEKWTLNVQ